MEKIQSGVTVITKFTDKETKLMNTLMEKCFRPIVLIDKLPETSPALKKLSKSFDNKIIFRGVTLPVVEDESFASKFNKYTKMITATNPFTPDVYFSTCCEDTEFYMPFIPVREINV